MSEDTRTVKTHSMFNMTRKNRDKLIGLIIGTCFWAITLGGIYGMNKILEERAQFLDVAPVCQKVEMQYGYDKNTGDDVQKREYIPCADFETPTPHYFA